MSNSPFIRFDPDTGRILSGGHMSPDLIEAERASGVAIVECEPPADFVNAFYVDGAVVYRDAPAKAADYRFERAQAYPSVSDFADALYWREQATTRNGARGWTPARPSNRNIRKPKGDMP